jgi:N6-L-threonylcarbamoyladenine synthase
MLKGNQAPEDPDYFDFSFSGLKTATATLVAELSEAGTLEEERQHVAAAFQDAVVDVLASKTMRAVEETGCRRVLLGGGVSANRRLKTEIEDRLGAEGRLFHASPRLSLDNGAMVARAGVFRMEKGEFATMELSADANLPFPNLTRRTGGSAKEA